jgi:hypothetical protein
MVFFRDTLSSTSFRAFSKNVQKATRSKLGVLTFAAAIALCGPASAADPQVEIPEVAPVAPISQGWKFTIAPYVWTAGLSGDLSHAGTPLVHFDAPFSNLLSALKFGGMLVGEARYDRFVLFSDLIDLNLSESYKLSPFGMPVEVDVRVNLFEWTPMFGYSLVKTPDWNFDVMVGIRLWSLNLDTSIDLVNVMSVTPNLKETWVDAMVGVKSQYALTDKFFVAGWAMVGTGGSTYTWDLMGSVGYKHSDRLAFMAGYRAQAVDYNSGSYNFKTTMQGPILGATFKF